MKKIVTVIGARPQFIKAGPVSQALEEYDINEILVHTGQHYDQNMSDVFFQQMGLKQPKYNLQIGSGTHGYQTGEALKQIEEILNTEKPDAMLVYGDTNATLSGALAAAKLHIPIAHIEAGIRSYNRLMPEEINRVLTDHVSKWLFIPTEKTKENLTKEGIVDNVYFVGDVMLDAVKMFSDMATKSASQTLGRFQLKPKDYILMTIHRAENTNNPDTLIQILKTLDDLNTPILFPVHPRIRKILSLVNPFRNIYCIDPLSYFEMMECERNARIIVTDSGGVQKEAVFFEVPCITLRKETEWVETVESGWNQLVGLNTDKLLSALQNISYPKSILDLYGNGNARYAITQVLEKS